MLRPGKEPYGSDETPKTQQQCSSRPEQHTKGKSKLPDLTRQASLMYQKGSLPLPDSLAAPPPGEKVGGIRAKAVPVGRAAWALKNFLLYVNNLFVRSKSFESLAKRIFSSADVHHQGRIDEAELFVCVLLIYDTLNRRLPTYIPAPTRDDVVQLMHKADQNRDGKLDFEEFLMLLRRLFGITSPHNSVLINAVSTILLRLVLLPILAQLIRSVCAASELWALQPLALTPVLVYVVVGEIAGRWAVALWHLN